MEIKELIERARSRLDRHPVLAAMATRIDVREAKVEEAIRGTWVSIEFDGPALPEKRTSALFLPAGEVVELSPLLSVQIDQFLDGCEHDVAAAIKRAAR